MSEVSVASTTDDLSAVQAAADVTKSELEGAAIPAPVESVPAESRPEQTPEAQHEERHPATRTRTSVQKRIDRITAKNYALADEVQQLRSRLSELEGAKTESTPPTEVEPARYQPEHSREPKFTPQAEAHRRQDELKLIREQELRDADHARQQQYLAGRLAAHQTRLEKALADPGVREMVTQGIDIPVRQDLIAAILEHDNSELLTIHLAQNPSTVEQLNAMEPSRSYSEIAKLSARLEGKSPDPRPVRRHTPKPAPINPVGGSSTASVPLDELDYASYRRVRDQQEKARRRF